MDTSQFEGKKIAMKQSKDGFVLSLAIHPDDLPEELMRDFVGARYMVVMVRLDDNEMPMQREQVNKHVATAGILCRDPYFWEFLYEQGLLLETSEANATDWLKTYLNIVSRKELKDNREAQMLLNKINKEFKEWKS